MSFTDFEMTAELRAAIHRADVVDAALYEMFTVVNHVTTLVEWLCTSGEEQKWPFRTFEYFVVDAQRCFSPLGSVLRSPTWGSGVRIDGTHERDYSYR